MSISASSSSPTKLIVSLRVVDASNSTQAERRRCGSRLSSSSCYLPVDLHRRSCSCIPRSSTRAGPRSAPSSATCGTRQIMRSSSIAQVRSPLCATVFVENPSSWEGQDWGRCCSASSCPSLVLPLSSPTEQIPISSPAPRLTQFQPIMR